MVISHFKSYRELTRRSISLKRRNDSGFSDLVRTTVVHVHGLEEQHVALLSYPRSHSLHDLSIDRLLVISNQVLVEELLDLVW